MYVLSMYTPSLCLSLSLSTVWDIHVITLCGLCVCGAANHLQLRDNTAFGTMAGLVQRTNAMRDMDKRTNLTARHSVRNEKRTYKKQREHRMMVRRTRAEALSYAVRVVSWRQSRGPPE
jgi:hypothetical protein